MKNYYNLVNVNIIPMSDENIINNAIVKIENRVKASISANIEADCEEQVIDCKGGYLRPAFCNIHMGVTGDNGNYNHTALFCEKTTYRIDFNGY